MTIITDNVRKGALNGASNGSTGSGAPVPEMLLGNGNPDGIVTWKNYGDIYYDVSSNYYYLGVNALDNTATGGSTRLEMMISGPSEG
jgi:hypothetical protein